MPDTRLKLDAIEQLSLDTLVASGASAANAAPLARAIMQAERDGIASHGLMYLPVYAEHLRCGKVDGTAVPDVGHPRPGVVRVDAGTGFAHPAIAAGSAPLIEAARANGIACMAVHRSYNCGVLGHHAEALAGAGLLALCFTNAPASIAPAGGRRAVVGTNPMALALPDGEGKVPLVIDQSASVVAKSEVTRHARAGQPLPDGWALDAEGRPTRDAEAALAGTMMPAGGYKGFGLGLVTEIFAAVMTGANLGIDASPFSGPAGGPPQTGQFFIAVDPAATSGAAGTGPALARLCSAIADQPGVRLPGQRRRAARARAEADGVVVDDALLARLRALI